MSITSIREKAVKKWMWPVVGVLLVALLVTVFAGFGANLGGPGTRPDGTRAEVAFKIDGDEVDDASYRKQIQLMSEQMEQQGQRMTVSQLAEMKMQLVPGVITQALLAREARESGIRVSRGEVNRRYDELVDNQLEQIKLAVFGEDAEKKTERQLDSEVQNRTGRSLDAFMSDFKNSIDKDALRTSIMVEKLQEKIRSQVQLTDKELEDRYRAVEARHIFVSAESRPEAVAKKRADQVYQKLKDGSDFQALAKEYSDDRMTAENGGTMAPIYASQPSQQGMMSFGQPPKEVREAALRLDKKGAYTRPIDVGNGFEIVQLIDSRKELPKDFSKKKKEYLKEQQESLSAERWQERVEKIQEDASIEFVNPEFEGYWLLSRSPFGQMPDKKTLDSAAKAFDRHIKANVSENVEANTSFVQLARIQMMQDKKQEAIKTLKRGLQDFEDGQVRMQLAQLYRETGQMDLAEEQYREAAATSRDVYVHMQLQQVFANDFPDEELAAKSQAIVEREMKRQQEMMQAEAEARQAAEEAAAKDKPAGDAAAKKDAPATPREPAQGDNPADKAPKGAESDATD